MKTMKPEDVLRAFREMVDSVNTIDAVRLLQAGYRPVMCWEQRSNADAAGSLHTTAQALHVLKERTGR